MATGIEARYLFIEQVAWWEGRINATHLCRKFNISRQAASGIINKYRKLLPNNLQYNASIKGHIPTKGFTARTTKLSFSEYLNTVSNNNICQLAGIGENVFEVQAPLRNINPVQVRPILRAIREKLAIDIGYISLSSPEYLDRIIQPHTLIFDGLRWHVRAYCNKNSAFRDFTLSRFNGEAVFEGAASNTAEQDQKWHTQLDITIEPDPRLSAKQQQVIATDFQMTNHKRTITTRAALVNYLLLRLRLDSYKNTPEEQQIVLTRESRQAISPYLPKIT